MFVLKTQKELAAMSEEDVDKYMTEKAVHDKAENQKEIDKAVNAAKEALEKEAKKAQDSINDLSEQLGKLKEATSKDEEAKKGTFVDFVEKTIEAGTGENRDHNAKHTVKAAALMTTANVIPNVASGFSPLFGNYIDTEIGHAPVPENIIIPLITVKNQPGTEAIWYSDRINEEGDAAFIAEGSLKPLADAEWKTSKAEVKEVAVRWKFTKRLMKHAPSIVVDFAEHARELVDQKIDDQLLDGDGTGNNLTGLESVAAAFIAPSDLAGYYAFANIYDAVMAVSTQIRLSNFKGRLTAVLNTVWAAKMAGIKDLEGRYIIAPFVTPSGDRIGEVEVKFSNKIGVGKILVGDLKKFNLVIAENVEYDEGYENDDFSKNLVSKKLEAFMGTYIKASDAGSIVYDDIASILTDIEIPVV